ncbi:pyridoxamine 5'-phosphate oxidase [Sorangium cellulosum]|uniref:Pyridoxamine 5'-phosphate oxidase n=1 Tax=Sorangium cellulosum TaxID=56 RepID=A0A4P2Q3L1_SORCE|nr:pyridoxamine 5'-phosphate oxidase family protein [Sorangium cellulosum]AUX23915.1 pyridoxamine 5'-phosphate oxidase [Sorangium cellulosum]
MGRTFSELNEHLTGFLAEQPLFFVASAPSGSGGHVNVSPKGHDTFRILDPRTVAYLDLTGSGVETIAHLRDNGRITLMFCAFTGPPNIVRLYGRGEPIFPADPRFDALVGLFAPPKGVRAVIRVEIERVATSCGYAVPFMAYEGERDTLMKWVDRKGPEGIAQYQLERNATSIDGLPGLPAPPDAEAPVRSGAAVDGRPEAAQDLVRPPPRNEI